MFKNNNGCFNCDKCPKNNDPSLGRFCVAWFEKPGFRDGKPEVLKSCGFPVIFNLLTDNCKATDVMTSNLTQFPKRMQTAMIGVLHEQKKLNADINHS